MTLEWSATLSVILIVVAGALIAGLIVILARSNANSRDPQGSIIRSWIAITLVIGLLVLSAATFGIDDETLRSTLIGGLTASAGGAIAFYFSSKSADQARQDLLAAAFGKEIVPNLGGKTPDQAKAILGTTTLKLSQENPPLDGSAPIKAQQPPPGAEVIRGSTVQVTYANKVTVPKVSGMNTAEARTALTKAALGLASVSPAVSADAVIKAQDPPDGTLQWEGSAVTVTYEVTGQR